MPPAVAAPVLGLVLFAVALGQTRPPASVATRRDAPDSCRLYGRLAGIKSSCKVGTEDALSWNREIGLR